jgi:D-alanyl-D-alanine carboxypeptidase/D-alanyl-D-alanine-endopeptidase (penicillin-binding protein 4)
MDVRDGVGRLALRAVCAMLAAALAAGPATAHQAQVPRLEHLLDEAKASQSHLGFEARRLSGELLYAVNSDKLFSPASVLKLATTYAVLHQLGPETRFKTELLTSAPVSDGELAGDLWVKGHGDPTLRTADLGTFVTALQAQGVTRIAGDLVADSSLFEGPRHPEGWMWDDLGYGFAAPMSALSLDSNAGLSDPQREPPELRAAQRLSERLAEAGIALAGTVRVGKAPAEATVRYRQSSPPVAEIVRQTNKESDNFYAETLVRHLGLVQATGSHVPGTHAAGMAALHGALGHLGWEPGRYHMSDGSGLSRYDAVTPAQMTGLLLAAARMPQASRFLSSLPVAGVDGTLATRMRGTRAQGVVLAKTGTMSGVSSLCGYVLLPGKEPVAFTLMVNGFVGSAKPVQDLQDAVMDAMIEAID